jgi:hypothetical protein
MSASQKILTPADLSEKRKTVKVNPAALTIATQAFEAGFRAALRGVGMSTANYKTPLLIEAYERGWQHAKKLGQKTGGR